MTTFRRTPPVAHLFRAEAVDIDELPPLAALREQDPRQTRRSGVDEGQIALSYSPICAITARFTMLRMSPFAYRFSRGPPSVQPAIERFEDTYESVYTIPAERRAA